MASSRRTVLWIGAALLALPAGGLLAGESRLFSHRQHVTDLGAACDDCHRTATTGLPKLDRETCASCHQELPAWRLPGRSRSLAIEFPHTAHAAGLACRRCHAEVIADRIADGAPLLERAACESCHGEVGVASGERACRGCHGVDERGIVPADHRQTWLARHGREARWRVFDDHGRDCAACHRSEACAGCHRERMPRDHSGLWRVRMHGSAAAWDRDRCRTCHETGVCERCHQTSEPVSHRGAWRKNHGFAAGGFDGNCTVCHQRAWCLGCHRGGGR
ncbi:MAG: cytochrome c3 family protein [Deltaproteobacteria bacterium]|nr:cytochrome c3 family protein [Deltaproteobacteria bacterium]